MSYIVAVIVFGALIFFHELGHFISAKATKMPVKAFALGFGPTLIKFSKGGTDYKLNLFPLGGYVSIDGENSTDVKNGFLNQPWYYRLLVLASGVIFNFIFAIVLFIIMFVFWGSPEKGVEITYVEPTSAAYEFIEVGDQLVAIEDNYVDTTNYVNVTEWIKQAEKPVEVILRRGNEQQIVNIPLTQIEGREVLGIYYQPKTMFVKINKITPSIIFMKPFEKTFETGKIIIEGFSSLIQGEVAVKDMTGPVGIIKYTSDIAKNSIGLTIYWTAMLSINLGFMNALPIPALDGGQILFLVLEKILGDKRWNKKVATIVNSIFLILLLGFSLVITISDIIKFI